MARRRDRLKANEIALLRFAPKVETSPALQQQNSIRCSPKIRCHSEVVCLRNAPAYVALSYVWGDATITKPITIDGNEIEVTSNLKSALRHIQSRLEKTEALWVGAVCINQQDDVEKSEQVAHMHDVYANAARVLVWLGPAEESEDLDLALDWLMSFGERAARFNIGIGKGPTLHALLSRFKEVLPNGDDSIETKDLKLQRLSFADELKRSLNANDNPEYEGLVQSLQGFLSRKYWERLWIVQEFALAKRHDLICASRRLDFRAVMYAVRILRNIRFWQDSARIPASTSAEEALQRYSSAIPLLSTNANVLFKAVMKQGDLLYMLRMYASIKAKDPRDRIFAFLGMATDTNTLELVPDYTKPEAQIYTEVARALLKNGQYDVLAYCNASGRDKQDLQSWVPDWSRRLPLKSLLSRVLHPGSSTSILQTSFKASDNLEQPGISNEDSHGLHEPLVLSVIVVCNVAAVGTTWRSNDIGSWLQSLAELASLPAPLYHAKATISNAIWQTAVAGLNIMIMSDREKPRIDAATVGRLNAAFMHTCWKDIDSEKLVAAGLTSYQKAVINAAEGRRGFLTSTDRLACGPDNVEAGDLVVVVLGAKVPFVVRKRPDGHGYTVLGEAYVHGYMDGEAADANAVLERIVIR